MMRCLWAPSGGIEGEGEDARPPMEGGASIKEGEEQRRLFCRSFEGVRGLLMRILIELGNHLGEDEGKERAKEGIGIQGEKIAKQLCLVKFNIYIRS